MTEESPADEARELAQLIRKSTVLDPLLKRQWLGVLPHLKAADHARLRAILEEGNASAAPKPKRKSVNKNSA